MILIRMILIGFTAYHGMVSDASQSMLIRLAGHSNNSDIDIFKKEYNRSVPVTSGSKTGLSWNCSDWKCSSKNCYCDGNCLLLKDCCIDSFASVFKTRDIDDVHAILRDPGEFLKRNHFRVPNEVYMLRSYSSCYNIRTRVDGRTSNLLVIDRCPDLFFGSDIERTNCEQMDQSNVRNFFVTHNGNSKIHIIYRNIFCAFCHNVSVTDLVLWKMNMYCNDKPITLSEIQDKCTITFDIPLMYGQDRKCVSGAVDTNQCHQTGINIQDNNTRVLCSGYYDPIHYENKIYKNHNCLPCLNPENITDKCLEKKFGQAQQPTFSPGSIFQLLFSITNRGLTWNGNRVDFTCGINLVYDIHTHMCRKIICPNGLSLVDAKCVLLNSFHFNDSFYMPNDTYFKGNYIYKLEFEILPTMEDNTTAEQLILSDLLQSTKVCGVCSFNTDSIQGISQLAVHSNILSTFINISSSEELSCYLECIQNISHTFNTGVKITLQNFSNHTNLICENSLMNHVSLGQDILFNEAATVQLNMNRSVDLYSSRFGISFSNGNVNITDIYSCDQVETNCSKLLSYNFNEYKYINDTLV